MPQAKSWRKEITGRWTMSAEPNARMPVDVAERLRAILASKDLTLYQVSQQSEVLYGHSSPYFLPHNLYYDLRSGTFTLSIHQLAALSRVSGYRLNDWVRAFGFDLQDIVRLQVLLPSNRTVILNSTLDDAQAFVPRLESKAFHNPTPAMAPLSELLEFKNYSRLGALNITTGNHLYAKIGGEDTLAFPELLPGSIVRANVNFANDHVLRRNGATSNDLFLIEHSKGFYCCRLQVVEDRLIVPVSTQLPYGRVELQVPEEARNLGVVDLEIRSLVRPEHPEVAMDLARHWRPRALEEPSKLGPLLRNSRMKMNLSLRDASALSRRAADLLRNEQYFVSSSSLSDYEALDTPPRHFHKTITLCSLYGLQFNSFLRTIGIEPESLGKEVVPDRFVGRDFLQVRITGNMEAHPAGFLATLLRESAEIPFFLRDSLEALSGISEVSLDDCFWVGGERNPLHPYLMKALVVIVNRRKRKPIHFRSKPLWEQPLYVLLKRDGTYLCACCGLENGSLVVHPYSQEFYRATRLRYHDDAEIVGQVVTIARKLR